MALIVLAAAAAFLTPVLNPERIAANNQIARFEAGKMPPEALDLAGLARWGRAGVKALARLEEIAKQPGQQALAMHLQSLDKDLVKPGGDIEALRTALRPGKMSCVIWCCKGLMRAILRSGWSLAARFCLTAARAV